jgi:hypothetical protein
MCCVFPIPNTDHYARFIDEDSPINHSERIRGYGGVAILWHPNLTPYIRPLPDGTNHIIAVFINKSGIVVCIRYRCLELFFLKFKKPMLLDK